MKKIVIAEDCAGLGTASYALDSVVRKSQFPVEVRHLYASELDDSLRSALKHKFKFKLLLKRAGRYTKKQKGYAKKRVKDAVDIYINGFPCQPWSKQGLNQGLKDAKKRCDGMKKGLTFVKRVRPKIFVFEQVKNFVSKQHLKIKTQFLRKLKAIKRTKHAKPLYHIREAILQTNLVETAVAVPQIRERYFCVGLRADVKSLRRFQFPFETALTPDVDALDKLLGLSAQHLKAEDESPRTYTEKRNWATLTKNQRTFDTAVTVVADLCQSEKFKAHFIANQCPTITRPRALQEAFWQVKMFNGTLVKRKIRSREYLKLQGWLMQVLMFVVVPLAATYQFWLMDVHINKIKNLPYIKSKSELN